MKKKGKKRSSEAVNAKKPPKKLNPFEIHVNRRKHDVIGMKSKAEKGLPGVSRSKAISKRKATLLQEYRSKDKKNIFWDKRIGERNKAMTEEDKIVARYTAERMRSHSKKSRYNLGDTEELTHWGQSITDVEKFDDPRSDDEEDEDRPGKLDSDFVKEAHFGGGMLRKVDGDGNNRQSLIDQLIAESKKRKIEKQRAREQTIDLTQQLDSEWKELLPLVTASKRNKKEEEEKEPDKKDEKFASYDKLSKQLKFEPRAAKVTDKLKSEEEVAREEKEKLEKLEKERKERMLGEPEVKEKIKHRSADDLDDGFVFDGEETFSVDEKNGKMDDDKSSDEEKIDEDEEARKEEEEEGSVKDEEDSDEEEEIDNENDAGETQDDENVEEEEENREEGSDDESLDLSDLKESDESDDEEQIKPKQKPLRKDNKPESKEDLEKKNLINKEVNDLPFTFDIPDNYDDFENLMKNRNPDVKAVIVERMLKCNHPKLLKPNKNEKLDLLFTFLLQHLQDSATDDNLKYDCFKILDKLSPWLFDLTQWTPDDSTKSIGEVIKEKYQDFLKTKKVFPDLDTLIFLKLVSVLYPTSDYRHKIVTPCFQFMQDILSSCRVTTSIDVSIGLFITTLIFEYSALSKRYVPEAVNFLRGILRLAHSKNLKIPTVPPFKLSDLDSFSLEVKDKSKSDQPDIKMSVRDLIDEGDVEEFKIKSLNLALNLLNRFCSFWGEEPSSFLIFEPFVLLLNVENYPVCLRETVGGVLNNVLNLKKKPLLKLMLEKKKPKPLRLYEPEIEPVYTFKKHKPMPEDRRERAKLLHKVKQETKGALREIRRDRQFLAKVRFKEAVKSDVERKRKVKEIYGAAAQQMGELKKFKKKK